MNTAECNFIRTKMEINTRFIKSQHKLHKTKRNNNALKEAIDKNKIYKRWLKPES